MPRSASSGLMSPDSHVKDASSLSRRDSASSSARHSWTTMLRRGIACRRRAPSSIRRRGSRGSGSRSQSTARHGLRIKVAWGSLSRPASWRPIRHALYSPALTTPSVWTSRSGSSYSQFRQLELTVPSGTKAAPTFPSLPGRECLRRLGCHHSGQNIVLACGVQQEGIKEEHGI
jgi:hypothetical protein